MRGKATRSAAQGDSVSRPQGGAHVAAVSGNWIRFRRAAASLLCVIAIAGCYPVHREVHIGSNNGKKEPQDIDSLIEALSAFPIVYPAPEAHAKDPPKVHNNFLDLYYGSAYNAELVDLVYFFDVDVNPESPSLTIRSALNRGDEQPTTLRDEQNIWALVMVAVPTSYWGDCFTAELLHEVIAPVPSPAETGIVAALLSLTKLGTKPDAPLASRDNQKLLVFPKDECKGDGADKTSTDKASTKESAVERMSFRLVGSNGSRDLYAGSVKLSLSAGTTNRIVLRSHYHSNGEPESVTTSVVATFRNASRPYFRTSVALGMRLELEGVHTTTEVTQRGAFYDPDLYVMFHALPGFAGFLKGMPGGLGDAFGRLEDFQLRGEWYPSLFIGTNLISRSVFTDLVFGVRVPVLLNNKVGLAFGGNWSRFTFNTDETCTGGCITRTRRHLAMFLGLDYDF